jgi:serine protease
MTSQHAAFGAVLASFLAACGGGSSDKPNPPTGFTVSGTMTSGIGQVADADTKDPNTAAGNNDTAGAAQQLPSTATVGGWASQATDPEDWYRASLAADQVITLLPADTTGDVDLCLVEVGNPTNQVCSTNDVGVPEQIAIGAGGGEFYVVVVGFSGSTNYLLVLGQGTNSTAALRTGRPFVPGEVLVRFRDDAIAVQAATGGPADLQAKAASLGMVPLGGALRGQPALLGLGASQAARAGALASLGAKTEAPGFLGEWTDGEGRARRETMRAIQALRARPDVASADPNYIFQPSAVPNDTYYPLQWHYPLINLPQAWDITTGTPTTGSVVVAVVDTGVVLSHPDLAGKLVAGYDFISSTAMSNDGTGVDPDPNDPGDGGTTGQSSFHGTHVAGTVAARSNDGAGVAGVSWGAQVMPVRVLGKGGGTSFDIVQGVRWAAGLPVSGVPAAAKKADVMNLSLGCLDCFSATEQAEYTAARTAGTIIVAAAGNENSSLPGYPASYTGVVSVSAVDTQGVKAPYSNRGPNVDIAAPGGDTSSDKNGDGYADGVLSTLVEQDGVTPIWSFYQGTSMASPHMAGVVALMKAVCPTLTPAQLDTIIASGSITTDLGTAGRDDVYGHGLVNALSAVQAAQAQCGAGTTTALTVDPVSADFGNATTTRTFTAAKSGSGALTVTGVTDDAAWLTVTPATVDGNGLGTYTATVNRTGLASGSYDATITFATGGPSVLVRVTMRVGAAAPTTGDAGFLYLLITDSAFNVLGQAQGRGTSGSYPFSFTGVPTGSYYLVAGTDSDDDGLICDAGEACGAWPTLGVPTPLEVAGASVTGLTFVVGFDGGLALQSVGARLPEGGVRRLDRERKSIGGAP